MEYKTEPLPPTHAVKKKKVDCTHLVVVHKSINPKHSFNNTPSARPIGMLLCPLDGKTNPKQRTAWRVGSFTASYLYPGTGDITGTGVKRIRGIPFRSVPWVFFFLFDAGMWAFVEDV